MNRFALIGASYKTAGVERLGQIALPKTEIEGRLPALASALGVSELAYIGTCNRVEFVVASEGEIEPQACRDKIGRLLSPKQGDEDETRKVFRAWMGEGAVEHLFLVTAGLDSAQAGEREIYAQIRGAWHTARAAGTCGPQLDYLFAEALRAAQEVHEQAARPANADSLATFAVRHALAHLGGKRGRIALVGISPMTRFCARALSTHDVALRIVNRTLDTAQEFAAEVSAEAQALDIFKRDPGLVDVVITAVGGAEPVLERSTVEKLAANAPVLIIDLGVPPNVDPAVTAVDRVTRIGMEDVIAAATEGRTARLGELADARLIIDDHLDRLRREYAVREAAPLIQHMGSHYQQLAAESLKRLPKMNGNGDDKEALKNWAEAFARRLAHAPIKGLRLLAAEAGPAAVQAYLRGVEEALDEGDKSKEKRS
jgi:glutamyl-tRNA reductase